MPGSGSDTTTESALVDGLMDPAAYPPPVEAVRLIETHISWVFLAGDFAYKFKKPLDLGFLDFRDPGRRLHFCREELRLNGRLAPELYLDIAGARHTAKGWEVGPWTEGAEPAVRMRRFPDDARLDRRLDAGRLDAPALEAFARELASFQRGLPPAEPGAGLGDAAAVARPALANFEALPMEGLEPDSAVLVETLAQWTRSKADALAPLFDTRLRTGFVREGHGDLHLGNLLWLDDRIVAFDGIEFDPALRWIDLQSEAAFLLMDLESRERADLGWTFYNAWLAALGDYDGLAVLPWYLVYRHLVRAKIDGIRRTQPGLPPEEDGRLQRRQADHVRLARAHAFRPKPLLILMHGYSGSGKSRLAARLAPRLPAAWVRSDIERKRLHGVDPAAAAPAAIEAGLYDARSSMRTYQRLAEIARSAAEAGIDLIVDAAFLDAGRREEFVRLALGCGARPVVLACEAPAEVLRRRVAARGNDPSDADLAVLEAQLKKPAEIRPQEAVYRLHVDTGRDPDVNALISALAAARS
jgi:uncharacterized protein